MKICNKVKYLILFLLSLLIIIFVNNNYKYYDMTIIKIKELKNINEKSGTLIQEAKGIVKNGKYKDQVIKFKNEITVSGVYDDKLNHTSEVFVELSKDGKSVKSIIGIKRDKYLVIMLVLFINLIIIIGKKKGLMTLLSLIFNVLLSIFATLYYVKYNALGNMLLFFIPISLIFIISSLLICHGFSLKTKTAVTSSIISLLVSFGLSFIILSIYSNSINYWNIDYIEKVSDFKGIFYLGILLSGLGAIMDIAITMASSINELINKDPNISYKSLKISGIEISKDIIGTMINVMLFTCFTASIPIIVLASRNHIPLLGAISVYGQIEMITVLTSSIGITLSIPISLYVSLLFFKGERK